MQKIKISLLFILITATYSLNAEIEEIVMTWNAFKCQSSCVEEMDRNLSAIKEVRNLQINASSGAAIMGWAANYPFSYEPFRYAVAAVGLSIRSMRLRVSGKIRHDTENVYLISNGDQTSFLLLGPVHTEPGRYTPRNMATHPLSLELKAKLLEAERKGLTVMISGPLYLPAQYSRTLIAEQIDVKLDELVPPPLFQRVK